MFKKVRLGEFVVPAVMVAFAVAYWLQAAALSFDARLFPMILTGAMVVLLVAIAVQGWRGQATAADGESRREAGVDLSAVTKRIIIVLVPVVLLSVWSVLGGLIFAVLTTLSLSLGMGERRPAVLVLMPLVLSIGLHVLFSTILHARIPHGLTAGVFG